MASCKNMMSLCALVVVALVASCYSYPQQTRKNGGTCDAYRRAYYNLRHCLSTCNYGNNYFCRWGGYGGFGGNLIGGYGDGPFYGGNTCPFRCIPIRQWCDGIRDCPYGDDEIDCPEPETTTTTTTDTTGGTTTTGTTTGTSTTTI